MKLVKVVGAVIRNEEGNILMAQRQPSENPYKSLKWEFPGGKIEPGEIGIESIKREILEELECEIDVNALIGKIEHEYPDFKLEMELYDCRLIGEKKPQCVEHNELRWVAAEEIGNLDLIEADYKALPLLVCNSGLF